MRLGSRNRDLRQRPVRPGFLRPGRRAGALLWAAVACAALGGWQRAATGDPAGDDYRDDSVPTTSAEARGALGLAPGAESAAEERVPSAYAQPAREFLRSLRMARGESATPPRGLPLIDPRPSGAAVLERPLARTRAGLSWLQEWRDGEATAERRAPGAPTPRAPSAQTPRLASAWPECPALLARAAALRGTPAVESWSENVVRALARLRATPTLGEPLAGELLADLRTLHEGIEPICREVSEPALASQLRRCGFALDRRRAIWAEVHRLAAAGLPRLAPPPGEAEMAPLLAAVETRLRGHPNGDAWADYFTLDAVKQAWRPGGDEATRRRVAQRAALRFESPLLARPEYKTFGAEPYTGWLATLKRAACAPPNLPRLLAEIEAYEQNEDHAAATPLAWTEREFGWLEAADLAPLRELLEHKYRNANARVAVSQELLNRVIPQPRPTWEPVADNILGADVSGRSAASTRVWVKLVPDPARLSLVLEARGNVASETQASRGPVTFFQEGSSYYVARKPIVIDNGGTKIHPTRVSVSTQQELLGMSTDYDDVPLVGSLVRSIARQQHDDKAELANYEVRVKMSERVRGRFDQEIEPKLAEAERRLWQNQVVPLQKLGLEPTPISWQTTSERLIGRARLAGPGQLGAHTPRPLAPSDSWLSAQIHQSALNNAVARLNLDGQRFDLPSLNARVDDALGRPRRATADDLPTDVYLRFADANAVRFDCREGRLELTLRLAELEAAQKTWRELVVTVRYKLTTNDLKAELVRDGFIEMHAARLRFRDQIALRAVFTKVFSETRGPRLFPDQLAEHPNLRHLRVNQFVLEEGWIGLALGPQRPADANIGDENLTREARKDGNSK